MNFFLGLPIIIQKLIQTNVILLSTKNPIDVHLKRTCITSSSHEKLLGITIDSDLILDKHISDLHYKVGEKINALCQVTGYMSLEKRKIVMKTFVQSQFNYCLLIWMLQSRTLYNKTDVCLHKRALRTVYSDYKSSFNTLLEKDSSFPIHNRNIQIVIEINKFLHDLCPAIMGDIIKLKKPLT